ncbi:phosphoribosylaminoimidazolesuccinocarboxamide synthase [Atribacter laminatus]|uniref:phosphoribosylaminoimidazolesuccinocarboxamide synthase n=1 Tax=Atribacter laminatus TaxID=2847778 RepID=A0A7T1F3M1_ATRLM|nr:phosphoribosylaminoimidazolesuccinocarboxamide synthase [Atribacter laminatus]QPM68805.1 Phosphoribosylaminoimidazole-succinocarboxamide synthase [Atribacter laminatus]
MGSVKDLLIQTSPRENIMGKGQFIFSDRYSVFDWGEMPDHIPYKGESLCLIGAYFFEKLTDLGYLTHYRGLEEKGQTKKLAQLSSPSPVMHVSLVQVIHPSQSDDTYDYGVYHHDHTNFLIPFEFIYRNSIPFGASFRKRVESGSINLKEYGLEKMPSPDKKLSTPILDVSTKLEEQDRYLTWSDVLDLNIINTEDINHIKKTLTFADELISNEVKKIGLENEDGKIELAFDPERNLMFVDVLGTPDECRFTWKGIHLSKEVAREFYRKTSWYEEVSQIKSRYSVGWKYYVKSKPQPLPKKLLQAIGWIYQRIAIDITGREWFSEVPSLEKIVEEIKEFV